MEANIAIGPIDWQLELDQDVTDFYLVATVAIGPILLAFRIRPGRH